MDYILVGVGCAAVMFCAEMWVGLPWFLHAYITRPAVPEVKPASLFSLSSVPAIMESRSVYEFIQALKNEEKRSAYDKIMSVMRQLIMDIGKHRAIYPADIDELKTFMLSQLRYNIEHSTVRNCVETDKFRTLAEHFIMTGVMHDIYVADCRASRVALLKSNGLGL